MRIAVPSGTYVIAVSGGVDSMVLLALLSQLRRVHLIVAHFDHGMRHDSQLDRKLVEQTAMSHNLRFVYGFSLPGILKSEAAARTARYSFLRQVCKKYNASAIITAHHQDDLLETAIINIIRGTGRRGLGSLRDSPQLLRPLLHVSKAEIVDYAMRHHIVWREDETNNKQTYLRNYVRHSILSRFSSEQRKGLLRIIVRQDALNDKIEQVLRDWYATQAMHMGHSWPLPRHWLVMLPDQVACEWLQFVVKQQTGKTLEAPQVVRALHFIKTARYHKKFELNRRWQLVMQPRGRVIVESRVP